MNWSSWPTRACFPDAPGESIDQHRGNLVTIHRQIDSNEKSHQQPSAQTPRDRAAPAGKPKPLRLPGEGGALQARVSTRQAGEWLAWSGL